MSTFGKSIFLLILLYSLFACSNTKQPEPMPPIIENADRPTLSMAQCQASGGQVVGDIGDGRIHRVDYLCENGKQPIATIIAAENEPQPIEGAVCCAN